MSRYARPTPSPIALDIRIEFKKPLLALKTEMCDCHFDASKLFCSVVLETPEHPARVIIRYGSHALGVPIIGQWPLDDLSPSGIVELVRELVDGIVTSHEGVVQNHADVALALCAMRDALPPEATDARTGSVGMEVCLEEDGQPIFWVENPRTGDCDIRLKPDLELLIGFCGPMPIPCHIYETVQGDFTFDTIGFSASEDEGILIDSRPIDAMQSLRLHRHVEGIAEEAAEVALETEA